MSRLDDLKSAATLSDLAKLLNTMPSGLSFILYKQSPPAKYTTFEIPKKTGGTRIIQAPEKRLKLLQQRLSALLLDCVDEINKTTGRKDRIAHGFKRKLSISTNAWEHRNRGFVFNIDLENFFPSINFGRVRGYFIRDKYFSLPERVATVIAQIACHENALPQGSPCSPIISNLIAHVLDTHLVRLASKVGCSYTRYADDLTFSTNKKHFPQEIAVLFGSASHSWIPGAELQRLITHSGFQINPTKTHMQYRSSRQQVTGLVVNKKLNTRSEYRQTVRAMVHRLVNTGSFDRSVADNTPGAPSIKKMKGTANQLHGMLGFIDFIDRYHKVHSGNLKGGKKPANAKGDDELSSLQMVYRKFLLYCDFFATPIPVILSEGETDNIYLVHALRSLAVDFPELVTISQNQKIQRNIRLYRYRKSSSAKMLGLGEGGSSVLGTFIANYKKQTALFRGPGETAPVIILYDNDDGAKGIGSAVKNACGKVLNSNDPFTHVVRNLYVVGTPLLNGAKNSKIEDFFEQNVRDTVLNGKPFDPSNRYDKSTHYGKMDFATLVVRQNAASINFDGFRPLLTNIALAIKSHAATISGASDAVKVGL